MKRGILLCLWFFGLQYLVCAEEYHLQQTDTISMSIYQEEDLQSTFLIGKSGNVSCPLIGTVKVVGLTVPEVEKKLKELYEDGYLVDPKISVIVVSYAKKWISVSGAVETPGRIPYPEAGTVNLASAIARAGGVMEDGNSKSITVARKKGGSKKYTLSAGGKVDLLPGDTVVVPRLPTVKEEVIVERYVTISGQVKNPGKIVLPPEGRIDILSAIAEAGGVSKIANKKECIVQKKPRAGSRHKKWKVNLRKIRNGDSEMVYLFPGDILIIKESRF